MDKCSPYKHKQVHKNPGNRNPKIHSINPVCLNRHTGRRLRVGFESKQVVGISIFNLALGIQLNNTKKYILFAANYSKAQSDMLNMFVLLSKPLLLRSPQKNTANNGKVGSTKRGDSNANRRLTWETFMSLRLQNGCIYLYLRKQICGSNLRCAIFNETIAPHFTQTMAFSYEARRTEPFNSIGPPSYSRLRKIRRTFNAPLQADGGMDGDER